LNETKSRSVLIDTPSRSVIINTRWANRLISHWNWNTDERWKLSPFGAQSPIRELASKIYALKKHLTALIVNHTTILQKDAIHKIKRPSDEELERAIEEVTNVKRVKLQPRARCTLTDGGILRSEKPPLFGSSMRDNV
jgi:hypothetical protein